MRSSGSAARDSGAHRSAAASRGSASPSPWTHALYCTHGCLALEGVHVQPSRSRHMLVLPLEEEGKVLPLSSVASHRSAVVLSSSPRLFGPSPCCSTFADKHAAQPLRHISRPSVHEEAFFNRTTTNSCQAAQGLTRPGETIVNGQDATGGDDRSMHAPSVCPPVKSLAAPAT